MTNDLTFAAAALLIALTAMGYAVATAGMKLSTDGTSIMALTLMAGGLTIAVIAEIALLRHVDMAMVYLAIIALETILILGLALLLGDGLTLGQVLGAGLVVTGLSLVAH